MNSILVVLTKTMQESYVIIHYTRPETSKISVKQKNQIKVKNKNNGETIFGN